MTLDRQDQAARRRLVRPALIVCLAAVCLLSGGCVRRRMTIRSFPPGAQVFVDDQEIGTTPCSAAFVYYGTRKITVIKDGYKTENVWQTFNAPWYQIPPLDFVTENLLINEIRDERFVDVQLLPEEIVPEQTLLDRAQALRGSSQAGAITPLLALPPGGSNMPIREPDPPLSHPGDGLPGGQPLPYEALPPAGPAGVP
jgi:hypothetical protein